MKKQVQIKQVSKKSCNGKYGTFIRQAIMDENGEWYGAPEQQWNFKPVEGMSVEIEFEINGQYKNLIFPKKQQGGGQGAQEITNELKKINETLTKILAKIEQQNIKHNQAEEEPPIPTDGEPTYQEDCPF